MALFNPFSSERRSVNPTTLVVLSALILFIMGLALPGLGFLAWIGGFIVGIYVLVLVLWIIFETHHW